MQYPLQKYKYRKAVTYLLLQKYECNPQVRINLFILYTGRILFMQVRCEKNKCSNAVCLQGCI